MQNAKTDTQQLIPDNKLWVSIVATLAVVALGVGVLNLNRYKIAPFSEQVSTQAEPATSGTPPTPISETTDTAQFPSTDDLKALVSIDNNAWIAGRQKNFMFMLSGEVPNQETKALIETAMRETYGDSSLTDLKVNPSVLGGTWFESSPTLIKTFASQIIEGSFGIRNGRLHLEGSVAKDANSDTLRAMTALPGVPQNIEAELEVTDQGNPTVRASRQGDKFFLFGFVPTQQIVDEIVAAGEDLYGAENVRDNLSVDDTTYAPFALARWQENLIAFFPFGEYRIEIKGGSFSGELRGGLAFDPSSSDLTSEGEAFLEIFPELANRSNGQISVIGHTDDSGSDSVNLELSQRRADQVAQFLSGQGISAGRIVATGLGETKPTASNSTENGRQINRRVEVKWDI